MRLSMLGILIVLIFLLSLSSPLFPGVGLLLYYSLGILALLVCFLSGARAPRANSTMFLAFLASILIVVPVQYFIFANLSDNADHSIRIISNCLISFGVFVCLSSRASNTQKISALWALTVIISGLMAVFEVFTGFHFSSPYYETLVTKGYVNIFVGSASFFGNPNTFAAFLLMAYPFLEIGALGACQRRSRHFFNAVSCVCLLLVFLTVSRLAIVTALLLLIAKLLGRSLRKPLKTGFVGLFVTSSTILGMACLTAYVISNMHQWSDSALIFARIENQLQGVKSSSSDTRLLLYSLSPQLLLYSVGIGFGVGRFGDALHSFFPGYSDIVPNPHALLFEILVELGFVPFILFLCLLINFWISIQPKYYVPVFGKYSDSLGTPVCSFVFVQWVPVFLISSFLASGLFIQPFFWLNIASISALSSILVVQRRSSLEMRRLPARLIE
jgi:hypothetical protein